MIGKRIAHYQVTAKIGEGGMGEVYQATDTRLNRDVALKILPEQFASDLQRMARFQREAEVLASLSHPNIGAIYGIEEAGASKALVLELIEGPTLGERIAQGPIPLAEALPIAVQIAEALEAAHEKGIIHRDLKPANIKITPEGQVKVLDFGLAKALDPQSDPSSPDLTHSPTLSGAATQAGVILGTAGYMSPEQARGKGVDKRADIWAFGCILYEMLSGAQAMARESFADTLGAIMAAEPDWSRLPADLPPRIRLLLDRCFEKDPLQRLRDIGDARIELLSTDVVGQESGGGAPALLTRALPWAVAVLMAAIAAAAWFSVPPGTTLSETRPARLSLALDEELPIVLGQQPSLALSPDGQRIVYTARTGSGTQLCLRGLGQYEITPIPGTEGASNPFFSPDGQWIGFFAGGKLKKIAASGGSPVTLVDAEPLGADWGSDGTIVFSSSERRGLLRTTAAGSPPEPLTTRNVEEADDAHHWPQLLPGGGAVLFTIAASSLEFDRLAVQLIGGPERRVLVEGASWGRYVQTPAGGNLMFLRAETLFAAPFDLDSLQITGREMPVVQGIRTASFYGPPQLALSDSGTLVYVPTDVSTNDFKLVWVDRTGAEQVIAEEIRGYEDLHLSPDGLRVAFTNEADTAHVWLHDIARQAAGRFVPEGESRDPVWTRDGRYISYGTKRDGTFGIYRRPFDGSGPEEEVYVNDRARWVDPVSWTPGDSGLVFTRYDPETRDDIWLVPAGKPDAARVIVQTPGDDYGGKVSPDGKWIAYVSNESGLWEVYIQPFPDGGRRWQISNGGGRNMDWSPDGRQFFYRNGVRMMVVDIKTTPEFAPSRPEVLFEGNYRHSGRDFAVSPDGQRFVMMKPLAPATGHRLNVITNWFEVLRGLTEGANR